MKKLILASVTIAILAVSPLAIGAFAAADDSQEHGRHHWMEERAALLDARLAGFKAALKLNSDQEKSWGLFENAVRDGAKARAENMRAMRERRESDEEPSPIDRMRMMSDRLAKRSAAVKSLADAATPLYVSLDDGQKRDFGLLFRDLVHRGRHPHG
jgi:zinc resistance-associated protein